jgi:hypothetical protein
MLEYLTRGINGRILREKFLIKCEIQTLYSLIPRRSEGIKSELLIKGLSRHMWKGIIRAYLNKMVGYLRYVMFNKNLKSRESIIKEVKDNLKVIPQCFPRYTEFSSLHRICAGLYALRSLPYVNRGLFIISRSEYYLDQSMQS